MDSGSFDRFFELSTPSKFEKIGETLLHVIETLEDDTAEAKDLDIIHEFVEIFGDEKIVCHEFESCKFKGKDGERGFLTLIDELLPVAEIFIAGRGLNTMTAAANLSGLKYFKFRVWEQASKKDFAILLEDADRDEIKIHLKNLYETHAPEGRKVKAEGECSYELQRLWKDFGINYQATDYEDRVALCSVISESFRLETFEKKLEPVEYVAFEKNSIFRCPIEYGCFERIYNGPNYKYPLSLSLVGMQGCPIGVKATIYKPEECRENGVFFLLDTSNWNKVLESRSKKAKNKTLDQPMVQNYNLAYVLKSHGFKILKEYIEIKVLDTTLDIVGVKSIGSQCILDILENPLSYENVIKYLQKHTDLLDGFKEEENKS